jgi:uncharacterized protein involved in exopolysaccharide biosynthesis
MIEMDLAKMDRSIEFNVQRLTQIVWCHKIIFVISALVFFTAMGWFTLQMRPRYEATAQVMITGHGELATVPPSQRKPVESVAALSVIAESEEVIRAAVERVGPTQIVEDLSPAHTSLIDKLRLGIAFLHQRIGPLGLKVPQPNIPKVQALLPLISRGLTVTADSKAEILRISYRHPDPVIAAKFANAITQALLDRQIELYSQPGAAEFFARQHQRFEEDYKRASQELEKFSTRTQIYSASEQQQVLLKRFSDLSSALAVTRGQIADKTGERQTLADSLRSLAPVARSPYVTGLVDSLAGGRGRAQQANSPLNERAGDYPPLLLVRVYQESMVALFKLNYEITGAQNLKQQQELDLANLTAELNNLSKNQERYIELKRAVDQAAYNLETYAKRTIEEQINAEASAARFSSAKILQRATVPITPVSPNFILMGLLGVGGGILSGLTAAMLRHWTVRLSRSMVSGVLGIRTQMESKAEKADEAERYQPSFPKTPPQEHQILAVRVMEAIQAGSRNGRTAQR